MRSLRRRCMNFYVRRNTSLKRRPPDLNGSGRPGFPPGNGGSTESRSGHALAERQNCASRRIRGEATPDSGACQGRNSGRKYRNQPGLWPRGGKGV